MIEDINKVFLIKSLEFLYANKMKPITLGKLQEIIHHGIENFDDIKNTKIRYVIENPNNGKKLFFNINEINFIDEIKMLNFHTKGNNENKEIFSLHFLQRIINEFSSEQEDWASVIINCQNMMIPTTYYFTEKNEIIFKMENPFK
jgi:hypothetical protein